MEYHPIANIFPLMEGTDFDGLCQDIAAYGLHEPIWTYNDMILDGRNRQRACEVVGVIPEYREYKGGKDGLLAFVVSMNLKRRHLNESQRGVIAMRLANMPKHLHKTDMQICTSQPEAAKMMNVSPRLVASAKTIEHNAPDLIPQIEAGKMSIHEAEKKMGETKRIEYRAELAAAGRRIESDDRWHVWQADIETWQAPRQYDFIITDPPYPKEYLPLYGILARRAKEWLKPGGLLVALSAHYWMNEIYKMLDEYLDYFWTAAYLVPGETAGVFQKHINPQWKPLIMYQLKDAPFAGRGFADVFRSDANDKKHHEWGQSESGMFDIISKICSPGQYILDPFCGAGTTGVAALKHECFFDGIDILEENVNISKSRINESL